MNENHLKAAPLYSFKNKVRISGSTQCGCYHCLAVFAKTEIKEWTDDGETAICPRCQIDTVIPDETGVEMTTENLKSLRDFWFRS